MTDLAGPRRSECPSGTKLWRPPAFVTQFCHDFFYGLTKTEMAAKTAPRCQILVRKSGLGKPQKKVPQLMARPLRGGGVKDRAIKEKRTFSETFFCFVDI